MNIEPLEHRMLLNGDRGSILFIRGADRSGGFLEATNDTQRTEQLADINNTQQFAGNHGWGELAATLRSVGYNVEQITETAENTIGPSNGIAIDFTTDVNLKKYDTLVFGSNNAVYSQASIDVIHRWVFEIGGRVLFISDANFGSNWRDASDSDQQFLDRFGLTINQDRGLYEVNRNNGDFEFGSHPVLGGINSFDGEGVTPVTLGTEEDRPIGVFWHKLTDAKLGIRNNDGASSANQFRGTDRGVTDADASLLVAGAGRGLLAVHFDRNTFFNPNGAGTDITRFDNRQFAVNLFGWLTGGGTTQVSNAVLTGSSVSMQPLFAMPVASTSTFSDLEIGDSRWHAFFE